MTTYSGGALTRLLILDQPLFSSFSRPRQAWEAVGGPIAAGALCGVGISVALWFYVLGVIVSLVGGLGTAAQHRAMRGALVRAFVAGALWALSVVTVHALVGNEPVVPLPDPSVWFLPYGVVPSVVAVAVMFAVGTRVRSQERVR